MAGIMCRNTLNWRSVQARPDKRIFVSSEWLVNWPGTFRQVALDRIESWDVLR